MLRFESDYLEGAHPSIIKKLAETNFEQTPGYGLDPHCEAAAALIKKAEEEINAVSAELEDGGVSTGTRNFTRDSVSVNEDYIDAAIVLEVGEYTGIVETDDGFYIIRLTDDDSDAVYETAVEEALNLAITEAFYEKYNEILEGYTVTVNSEVWDELPFGEITLEDTGV